MCILINVDYRNKYGIINWKTFDNVCCLNGGQASRFFGFLVNIVAEYKKWYVKTYKVRYLIGHNCYLTVELLLYGNLIQ